MCSTLCVHNTSSSCTVIINDLMCNAVYAYYTLTCALFSVLIGQALMFLDVLPLRH